MKTIKMNEEEQIEQPDVAQEQVETKEAYSFDGHVKYLVAKKQELEQEVVKLTAELQKVLGGLEALQVLNINAKKQADER